jgi:molybdopterin molybdotransferase
MALLPVDEARERILASARPLASESVALSTARGRVLARSVLARRDQPPFAGSAMDGYAVRAADVVQVPVELVVIGVSAAGKTLRKSLKEGEAARIFTGAPLPAGADAVVIQENTTAKAGKVTILQSVAPGKNVRRAGLDFAAGETLLAAPARLRPRDIGLLAAANAARVWVHRKPRIALFATGDELVLPGGRPRADQIVSSNSHALLAMIEAMGGAVNNFGIVRDTLKDTVAAVRKALKHDIVVTTGGASVGDHDYVQEAYRKCGVGIDFWKIAMRPGKPFMYGRKGKTHILGLPGNPVSALVTARLFLRPLIERLQGLSGDEAATHAILATAMPANDSRQDYVRASLAMLPTGERRVTPFAQQDSSMQRTLQRADALIIRPPHAPEAAAGKEVPVFLLDF